MKDSGFFVFKELINNQILKKYTLSFFLFPKVPNFLLPTLLELFIVTNKKHLSQIFDEE